MAFVRWRGNCAQLLATITVEGRPRHQLLANLHGAYRTTPRLWAQVAVNSRGRTRRIPCESGRLSRRTHQKNSRS